jgi:hypothetical protein
MAEFQSCRDKTMVPNFRAEPSRCARGGREVKAKGGDWWRCEEGQGSGLPLIGPRGGAGAAEAAGGSTGGDHQWWWS